MDIFNIHNFSLIIYSVLILTVLYSGITDILFQKIYNYISFPMIILGFGLNIVYAGKEGFFFSLGGFFFGFILFFVFYIFGGFGGGDVKLMAGVGAVAGYPFIMYASLLVTLIGAIMSIVVVISKGKTRETLKNLARIFLSMVSGKRIVSPRKSVRVSYGFAICLGVSLTIIFKDFLFLYI